MSMAMRLAVGPLGVLSLFVAQSCTSSDRDFDRGGRGGSGGTGGASAHAGATGDAGAAGSGEAGGSCTPGARSCDGAEVLTCVDATWEVESTCDHACLEGECVECNPGDRECDGADAERTCSDDGAWVAVTCASGCLDGACVEDCSEEGEERCRDGNTPERCDGWFWTAQDDCAGDTPQCNESTGTCRCLEGSRRCLDGDTPEECNAAGAWVPLDDCEGDTPACSQGACQCQEGDQECVDLQTARSCSQGAWVEEDCSGELAACNEVSGACDRPQALDHVIHCDAETNLVCAGTDVCCDHIAQDFRECLAEVDCPQYGAGNQSRYVCDNNTDCPSTQFCCLFGDEAGPRTSCVSEGGCVNGAFQAEDVCNPDGDDCEDGETCELFRSEHIVLYVCTPP